MNSSSNGGTKLVDSVVTALSVLETLKTADGMRLTELAEEMSIAKSTAHRYLSTLENEEYITRKGDEYHVGLRFLSLGEHGRNRQPGYELVKPKISQIAEKTGERAQFIVAEHGKAVYLYQDLGEQAVSINLDIGERIPLHAISNGKAIMAEWSDEHIEQYIETYGLTKLTSASISTRKRLFEELETIREQGYSINREEFVNEINSVGVSVVDQDENVLGAISVSGPTHRMRGERLNTKLPELLMGTRHELELNLKYN